METTDVVLETGNNRITKIFEKVAATKREQAITNHFQKMKLLEVKPLDFFNAICAVAPSRMVQITEKYFMNILQFTHIPMSGTL
jgi:hypothetical protein